MKELALLADTAGVVVVGTHVQRRGAPDRTYYVGSGKVDEVAADVESTDAAVIIVDEELSPAQARNIEKRCKVRVLDRSGLILDIFAGRARTRESRLQVELAQLEYMLPRLTRAWTHLERQAGTAGGGRSGSVGLRGPGETQLETDRRLVGRRIAHLKRELAQVDRARATQRKRRDDVFRCALVGYTNAGKSTLLKRLTGADVLIEDRLFATLDPTTRSFNIAPNKPVVLTDTVGFIRKLPHDLVASFRSTLSEAVEADIVLHVVDCSHPGASEQIATVHDVMDELDIHPEHTVLVMNKTDGCDDPTRPAALAGGRPFVAVSALTGTGIDRLRDELAASMEADMVELELRVPQSNGKLIATIHERGEVLSRSYDDNDVILRARLRRADAGAITDAAA
jgi:GTPase